VRQLIAGNWKMNGLRAGLSEIRAVSRALDGEPAPADALVCPPATLFADAVQAAEGGRVAIGAQDCHAESSGAFTGDISAEMLRDAGATYVIVGHSERRQYHHENDRIVCAKAAAAHRAGLKAIVCVGETEGERHGGKALAIVTFQLANSIPRNFPAVELVIAYEPVWAIGTGRTPSIVQIAEMQAAVRAVLAKHYGAEESANVRILYGGSVKPANAAEILAVQNVDGALVGGASLKGSDFLAIIRAAAKR
jgi:triosephosphate isomerase